MIDEGEFFAWIDGELPECEAARVATIVARSPELAAKAEAHRAMVQKLRGAFDGLLAKPVDNPSAKVVSLRPRSQQPVLANWWRQAAAIAASLVIGVTVGLNVAGSSAPVAEKGGKLVAAAALNDALTRRLASTPANDDVRIAMTFRDRQGRICRTFTDKAGSGLACNEEGQWVIEALYGSDEGTGSPYRMAAGPSPELASLTERLLDGEPFDSRQERAALQRRWQ